jgi:PAS domain S-box-containing protein
VSSDDDLLEESAEDLYENAPCGYLSCRPDGTIVKVNRTLESWTGHDRESLVGRRFSDLLTVSGRVYHETHYAPLLRMQGAVREIALEIVRRDGSRLPALVNAVQQTDDAGRPALVRTTIFDASDRRRYEQELLHQRRREQEIAQELQRSLLSGTLPTSGEFDVDVFYRPAVAGLEVGGDWYDAFWLDDRSVAVVVGDVVGRGLAAAATMGQVRSALRALASTGLSPARLLDALDRYAARHEVGRMTTIVYADLQLDTYALRYASAGHPPPVLIGADGAVRFVNEGRSLPLDAAIKRGPRSEAVLTLEPGDGLLLYTDGLIERRSRPLGAGLDRLLEELLRSGAPPTLATLARRLEDSEHPDDVCLLSLTTRTWPSPPLRSREVARVPLRATHRCGL